MALGLLAVPAAAAPRVVASIVPAHSIVAAVMGETGTPELLLSGSMGEHRATYTPGQISLLGQADLVFIIGHGLEAKLSRMSGSEAVNGKRFVELSEAEGVRTLPIRAGGAWVGHDHEHEEADDADGHAEADHADDDGHEHDGVLRFDPHVWLDPRNARAIPRAGSA